MKISGIYQIQSKIKPERTYIGSASDISNRWGKHLLSLRRGKHENSKIQRHYNKYGEMDFVFSILLGCDKIDLLKVEQYFIDSYNPYFNICKIAGSCLGIKKVPHTNEVKKRISDSKKGSIPWNKGKKGVYSADALKKMSDKRTGFKDSDETREKKRIRAINNNSGNRLPNSKGIHYSDERKQQCKDVWIKRKLDKINNN